MLRYNKLVLAGAFLILVGSGLAMAQDWKMDVYLGGRLGATKDFDPYDFGGNTNMKLKPNIAVGYNAWVLEIGEKMAVGPIVRFGLSFPQKVGVSYEAQDAYYKYTGYFLPNALVSDANDETMKSLGDASPFLLNLDGMVGAGFKFNIIGDLSLAAKLGFSLFYDSASMSWDNSIGGKTDFSAGYIMLGAGLDVAAQYVFPIQMGKMQLYAELGVNLAYFFSGFSTFNLVAKGKRIETQEVTTTDQDGNTTTSWQDVEVEYEALNQTGNGESAPRSFLSMGLPYLAIGIRF